MRALGQPAHHPFRPDNRHDKAFRVAVQRRANHQALGFQQALTSRQKRQGIRYMFDHFHVKYDIKLLSCRRHIFGSGVAIVDA